MALSRVFISYDYDNDKSLKDLLVGQSKHPDSPFAIADYSIKEASADWKQKARTRIRSCDVVVVLCGLHTDSAVGVSAELSIAKDEGVPYFLLNGYSQGACKKPHSADSSDKIYAWKWDNLKALIGGSR